MGYSSIVRTYLARFCFFVRVHLDGVKRISSSFFFVRFVIRAYPYDNDYYQI